MRWRGGDPQRLTNGYQPVDQLAQPAVGHRPDHDPEAGHEEQEGNRGRPSQVADPGPVPSQGKAMTTAKWVKDRPLDRKASRLVRLDTGAGHGPDHREHQRGRKQQQRQDLASSS